MPINEQSFVLNGTPADVFAFIKQNYKEERNTSFLGIGFVTCSWFGKESFSFNLHSLEYCVNKNLKQEEMFTQESLYRILKPGCNYGSFRVSQDLLEKSGLFKQTA